MKTLSIQQPWASMICAGVRDVENRTWAPKELPVRILIHASGKKVPGNFDYRFPEQWLSEVRNARTLGVLPENANLPASAIIGWADVTKVLSVEESQRLFWGQEDSMAWVLENVHLFEQPVADVKGKLNLFDYPLEEDDLPASRKAAVPQPVVEGREVRMPVSDAVWQRVTEQGSDEVMLDLTPAIFDILGDETVTDDYALKELETVCLTNRGNEARFRLTGETGIYPYPDPETGGAYEFKDKDDNDCVWLYVQFILGERL